MGLKNLKRKASSTGCQIKTINSDLLFLYSVGAMLKSCPWDVFWKEMDLECKINKSTIP